MFGPVSSDKGNSVMMWVVYSARLSVKRVRKETERVMGDRRGDRHSLKIA